MMMSGGGNGQVSVPPGFRFHPTDEELLYYYLRKKVSFEAIDLDVIREVDLNKLEPWDLKEICRIGTGPQNEWYFFSHKDKKYPTGTRTNRATAAGFWKATGRDKAIYLSNSKRVGMRKTLVFYTGRAPHGNKTDWIMHEYRLDDNTCHFEAQEDGWVVCRVFKKKNYTRGFQQEIMGTEDIDEQQHLTAASNFAEPKRNNNVHQPCYDYGSFDGSMQLPQLLSPDFPLMSTHLDSNLLSLQTCSNSNIPIPIPPQHDKFSGDWSFLDKLLASNHAAALHSQSATPDFVPTTSFHQHAPFDPHLLKFSK